MENFPYFYKTRDISESRRAIFLKLGISVRPEIWTFDFHFWNKLVTYKLS